MHDLLLAKEMLSLALQQANQHSLKKIDRIIIGLGAIVAQTHLPEDSHREFDHEITPDNLKYNFNLLKKDTIAANAKIIIESWPKTGWCLKKIYGTKSADNAKKQKT